MSVLLKLTLRNLIWFSHCIQHSTFGLEVQYLSFILLFRNSANAYFAYNFLRGRTSWIIYSAVLGFGWVILWRNHDFHPGVFKRDNVGGFFLLTGNSLRWSCFSLSLNELKTEDQFGMMRLQYWVAGDGEGWYFSLSSWCWRVISLVSPRSARAGAAASSSSELLVAAQTVRGLQCCPNWNSVFVLRKYAVRP